MTEEVMVLVPKFGRCPNQPGNVVKIHRPRPYPASTTHQSVRGTALLAPGTWSRFGKFAFSDLDIQKGMHVERQGRFHF